MDTAQERSSWHSTYVQQWTDDGKYYNAVGGDDDEYNSGKKKHINGAI